MTVRILDFAPLSLRVIDDSVDNIQLVCKSKVDITNKRTLEFIEDRGLVVDGDMNLELVLTFSTDGKPVNGNLIGYIRDNIVELMSIRNNAQKQVDTTNIDELIGSVKIQYD